MSYDPVKVALARSIIDPPKWVKVPSRDKKHLGVGSHILREGWVLQAFYGDNGLVFCTITVELDPGPGEYVFKANFNAVGRSMADDNLEDLKSRCIDMWYEEMSYMLHGNMVEEVAAGNDVYVGIEEDDDDDSRSMLVIALPKPLPTKAESPRLANTLADVVRRIITDSQEEVEEEEAANENYNRGQASMFDPMGPGSVGSVVFGDVSLDLHIDDEQQRKLDEWQQAHGNLRSWHGRFDGPIGDDWEQIQNEVKDHWQRQTHGDFEKLDGEN